MQSLNDLNSFVKNDSRRPGPKDLTNLSSCLKEVAVKAILKIDSNSFSNMFADVFMSVMRRIRIVDILIDRASGSDDW